MCLPDVFGVLQIECDHMISQIFKVFVVRNENDSLLFPNELQRCDNEECLAALESRPYLKLGKVGKVRKVRKLWHIFEIFCTYCN